MALEQQMLADVLDLAEAEAVVKSPGLGVLLFHVEADRSPGAGGLGADAFEQGGAVAFSAPLGKQDEIDHEEALGRILKIEAAHGLAVPLDDEKFHSGEIERITALPAVELVFDDLAARIGMAADEIRRLLARGGVNVKQQGFVGVGGRTQAEIDH